jgi:hypothetical protein
MALADEVARLTEAANFRGDSADGAPFLFTELSGQGRTVELKDSMMPEKGVEVGGELLTVKTTYPGASTASTQVLGTVEDDIEIQGELRDVWIGQSGAARAMQELIRDVWISRQRLTIQWGTALVLEGYLKRPRFTLHRDGVISYRLAFEIAQADNSSRVSVEDFEAVDTSRSLYQQLLEVLETAEELAAAATEINNVARAVL